MRPAGDPRGKSMAIVTGGQSEAAAPRVGLPTTSNAGIPPSRGWWFELDVSTGIHMISVLPDLFDTLVDGKPARKTETFIAGAAIYERILVDGATYYGERSYGTVITSTDFGYNWFGSGGVFLDSKKDDLASTETSTVNFWSTSFNFQPDASTTLKDGQGNPVTVEFTGQYVLQVIAVSGFSSPDAGRYLITEGNPTGQRADSWGNTWINFFDPADVPPVPPAHEIVFDPATQPVHGDERDAVASIDTTERAVDGHGATLAIHGIGEDSATGGLTWTGEDGAANPIGGLIADGRNFLKKITDLAGDVAIQAGLIGIQATADSDTIGNAAGAASNVYGSYQTYTTMRDAQSDRFDILQQALNDDGSSGRDYADEMIARTRKMVVDLGLGQAGIPGSILSAIIGNTHVQYQHSVISIEAGYSTVAGPAVDLGDGFRNRISFGSGDDMAYGAGGDDDLRGGTGRDVLIGGDGDDWLFGDAGDDLLQGGAGDDVLFDTGGNDRIEGGAGFDAVSYDGAAAGVHVDLHYQGQNTGGGGIDILIGIEAVIGTAFTDTLIGTAGDNQLEGGSGDDWLFSGAGSDVMIGGDGHDATVYDGLFRGYAVAMHDGDGTIGGGPEGGSDDLYEMESIVFKDGTLTTFVSSYAAQVMRLYDMVLHRAPDAAGLDHWGLRMNAGLPYADVVSAFLNSPEFQAATGSLSDSAFIDFLYTSALGRNADAAGKSYWLDQLAHGARRIDLLGGFSESDEHKALTAGRLADGLFVTDGSYKAIAALYDTFAGRAPDGAGLVYWAEQLKSGALSLSQVADGFATSAEFTSALAGKSNSQIVEYMYLNTLDRPGDAGGIAYWTNLLDQGLSRGQLLLGFSDSGEHYGLLGSDITGGIDFLS
jgi:Ca2+-binding RTX toxin-like protein